MQSHCRQRLAGCKGTHTDTGHACGNVQRRQRPAVYERIVPDFRHLRAEGYACQPGVPVERVLSHRQDVLRQCHRGQGGAAVEGVGVHANQGGGERHGCQRGAVPERIRADDCHIVPHGRVGQRGAAVKGIVADGQHAVRNGHSRQPRAPGEGVLADELHRAVIGNYGVVGAGDKGAVQLTDKAAVSDGPCVVGLVYFNGSQRVAVGKRALADGGYVRRDADALQRRTAAENAASHPDQLLTQRHLGQGGHIRESVVAHSAHGVLHNNLRDRLADALPRSAGGGAVIVRDTGAADSQHAGVRVKAPRGVLAAGAALQRGGAEHAAGIEQHTAGSAGGRFGSGVHGQYVGTGRDIAAGIRRCEGHAAEAADDQSQGEQCRPETVGTGTIHSVSSFAFTVHFLRMLYICKDPCIEYITYG